MERDRNAVWKDIWDKKGKDSGAPLHQIDGFDLLNDEQWDYMIAQVVKPLNIRHGDSVLECGCGAGAFLMSLIKQYPGLTVAGIDYSESLLHLAKKNIQGSFQCGDMTDLSFIGERKFDHVLSFSTFHYLSSEDAAKKAVREMIRVTKKGGNICIGEVSDLAKRSQAMEIRKNTHKDHKKVSSENPDHLFLSKDLFVELAESMQIQIQIVDHERLDLPFYKTAKYRYSVYLSIR